MSGWITGLVVVLILVAVGYFYNSQITGLFYNILGKVNSPKYYCDDTNRTFCVELENNCTNSIITDDSSAGVVEITITKKQDFCNKYFYVKYSGLPGLKGTSMNCEIPFSKLGITEQFKYCDGTLKDAMNQFLTGMMGIQI